MWMTSLLMYLEVGHIEYGTTFTYQLGWPIGKGLCTGQGFTHSIPHAIDRFWQIDFWMGQFQNDDVHHMQHYKRIEISQIT